MRRNAPSSTLKGGNFAARNAIANKSPSIHPAAPKEGHKCQGKKTKLKKRGLNILGGRVRMSLQHFPSFKENGTVGIGYCDYLGTWPKQSQYPIFVTRR